MWALRRRQVFFDNGLFVLTELQIGHITLDNAENHATAMAALQELLEEKGIMFDHKDNRIGCYPHIINICVSHIMSSLTKVDAGAWDDKADSYAFLTKNLMMGVTSVKETRLTRETTARP